MAYRPIRTIARIQSTTQVQVQANIVHSHLIKYNFLILSHPFSSSQVSLYGPPLNQQCQDDLPRTSNLPLYQSLGPLLGHPLTQPCQDDLYNTMKCPALYPALYTTAIIVLGIGFSWRIDGQSVDCTTNCWVCCMWNILSVVTGGFTLCKTTIEGALSPLWKLFNLPRY